MPYFELKKKLSQEIATAIGNPAITAEMIEAEFGTPPQPQLGHVALPCFKLSKVLRQASDKISGELAQKLTRPGLAVVPTGPYANFKWELGGLYNETVSQIFGQKENYGRDTSGKGQHIVIEYCSPNVAKKLAFQHIRSTLIGNVLANVHDSLGFETERMNFVGDWGTQFARLLAAVEKWGNKDKLFGKDTQAAMDHLFEVYVRFHKELENSPDYIELASKCLQKLESHDANATALWKRIREISLAEMDRTLKKMNVRFNRVEGESNYIAEIQNTLEVVKQKANARLSDGAWIVEVPGISTPALIQKKDGTTLYLTRDIAAAIDRFNRFGFDKMYYIVSEQQKLHFQLLFGVLELMGLDWAKRCEHLSFGTVLFGSEKMSTREGRVIFLDELLEEAKALALAECTKKNPDLANKEEVAQQVGVGAIIFGNLSSHRKTDIEFNWENVIAFDGETGPYVQYSLVRCYSLLDKAQQKGQAPTAATLTPGSYEFAVEEEQLLIELSKFRSVLHQVVRAKEPYHLTHYLIDLAKAFNRFYYKLSVLEADKPEQRQVRLSLVSASRQTLLNGLGLLGIESPREM